MDYFLTKGKCCDCETQKPLDSMIKKDKGLYHCIDCLVNDFNTIKNEYVNEFKFMTENNFENTEIKLTKAKKILKWVFG